jgi:hypothetical protein
MSEYILTANGNFYACDELRHHGVKGMKWGKRKATYDSAQTAYRQAKTDYKQAKKAYNKSFNKAYNRAIAAWSPIKKHRDANDARWEDAANKAADLNKAKGVYKTKKAAAKQEARRERAGEAIKNSRNRGTAIAKQIAKTELTSLGINVGTTIAQEVLTKMGKRDLAGVAGLAATGAVVANEIVGIKRVVDIAKYRDN